MGASADAPAIHLRLAGPGDAGVMAAIHQACFAPGWDAAAIGQFLVPGCLSLLAAPTAEAPAQGLLMARAAADEAELLTLGVTPLHRRQGLARALLRSAMERLQACGVQRLFLEVEQGNSAALGLYQSLGAVAVGRRPGYYAHGADAAIFSLAL
jgi:[ribosomal protein S18]-alanine N-acetyltransferase